MVTHSAFAGLSPEIIDSCKFFAGIVGSSAVDTRHIADFFLLQFLRTVFVYHAAVLIDLMQTALILQSSLFDCLFWVFNVHFYSPDRSGIAFDRPDRCGCHVLTVLSNVLICRSSYQRNQNKPCGKNKCHTKNTDNGTSDENRFFLNCSNTQEWVYDECCNSNDDV